MGEDGRQDRQDAAGHPSGSATERVSVPQAADHLGTTVDAIRKRVQRGTISHEKDADGRVWILMDTGRPRQDLTGLDRTKTGQHACRGTPRSAAVRRERQLEAERQAHAEARRIIGGLVQRIPELEAPSEPPGAPTERREPRS